MRPLVDQTNQSETAEKVVRLAAEVAAQPTERNGVAACMTVFWDQEAQKMLATSRFHGPPSTLLDAANMFLRLVNRALRDGKVPRQVVARLQPTGNDFPLSDDEKRIELGSPDT